MTRVLSGRTRNATRSGSSWTLFNSSLRLRPLHRLPLRFNPSRRPASRRIDAFKRVFVNAANSFFTRCHRRRFWGVVGATATSLCPRPLEIRTVCVETGLSVGYTVYGVNHVEWIVIKELCAAKINFFLLEVAVLRAKLTIERMLINYVSVL